MKEKKTGSPRLPRFDASGKRLRAPKPQRKNKALPLTDWEKRQFVKVTMMLLSNSNYRIPSNGFGIAKMRGRNEQR